MSLLLPVFAFVIGLLMAGSYRFEPLKAGLAMLLARVFIPIVIIYNMVFYQAGSLSLMVFSFVSAVCLYTLFMQLFKDRLGALCFSYVNMAWLGFPLAIVIFGPEISPAIVALYIGGSIFGNIWAVTAVSTQVQSKGTIFKKVIQSPPFVALILAGICRLLGLQHIHNKEWIELIYTLSKIGMTFAGMCVLGMWLRKTRVNMEDLKNSSLILALKLLCGGVICSISYFYLPIPKIEQYIGVMFLLFCLPPAANIVALETHYQGTGISAKFIASGTIVSCVVIAMYGILLHFLK